ncbi:MAG: FtsQ-type POTRA domain-containing protein [Christensenellaceae bacterium]|jgi:cell division septal protein FtsQ|nr:FtsQ-type POTRA domain-containing protein [Christensenellaceae bacterium]
MVKKKALAITGIILISLILTGVIFANVTSIDLIELRFDSAPMRFDESEILAVSKLKAGMSIFSVDETELTQKIEDNFVSRNVNVKNIERIWPNKIVIYIRERIPVCLIKIKNSDSYALIDMDFQMNAEILNNYDPQYISIKGIEVDNTFNVPQFAAIRQILIAFTQKGVPFYALAGLIREIEFNEKTYTYSAKLKNGETIYDIQHNATLPPVLDFEIE